MVRKIPGRGGRALEQWPWRCPCDEATIRAELQTGHLHGMGTNAGGIRGVHDLSTFLQVLRIRHYPDRFMRDVSCSSSTRNPTMDPAAWLRIYP